LADAAPRQRSICSAQIDGGQDGLVLIPLPIKTLCSNTGGFLF
jgi:hypothetical protein